VFKIYICLDRVTLTGLDALDERRRLGLPDGSGLDSCEQYGRASSSRYVAVTEGFARLHFGRQQTTGCVTVPLSALTPADLVAEGDVRAVFAESITDDRVRELYVAFKPKPEAATDD
jgi:hypothetical protein